MPQEPKQTGSPAVPGVASTPQAEKPERIGFGDPRHPDHKSFKEFQTRLSKADERARQAEIQLAEMRAWKEAWTTQQANLNRQNGPQIDPKLRAEMKEFFGAAISDPEIKQIIAQAYGLDRLDALHKDFGALKEGWEGERYESEMSDVRKYATEQGLDPDDVETELREYVEQDPFFNRKEYYKGGVWAAFRNKYWDKLGEFHLRAENAKRLKERETLQNGQTTDATRVEGKSQGTLPPDDRTNAVRRNVEIIRRTGMANLPFFKR